LQGGKGRPNKNCIPFFLTHRTFDGGEECPHCSSLFAAKSDLVRHCRVVHERRRDHNARPWILDPRDERTIKMRNEVLR
jgi:hypothetical protein